MKFEIKLENTTSTYIPGDVVSGEILVQTNDPEEVRGIQITLTGECNASWPKGKGRHEEAHTFIKTTVCVLGTLDWENTLIPRGLNEYPFQFQLPHNVPCTYTKKSIHTVTYALEAEMKRPRFHRDITDQCKIQVAPYLDLNIVPHVSKPKQVTKTKTFNCLLMGKSNASVAITATLEKRGYVPGEVINVDITVINTTGYKISDVVLQMMKVFTLTKVENKPSQFNYKSASNVKKSKSCLGQGVEEIDTVNYRGSVVIPTEPLYPTDLGAKREISKIIFLDYILSVKACIWMGVLSSEVLVPVIIGTVPLHGIDSDCDEF